MGLEIHRLPHLCHPNHNPAQGPRSDSVLYRTIHRLANRMSPRGPTSTPDSRLPARLEAPRVPATPSLRPLLRGAGKSPRLGGPICAEPLDDESARESRQRGIKHPVTIFGVLAECDRPATRGPSLSRGPRKPQFESVKKNMVIESFESSRESFARKSA